MPLTYETFIKHAKKVTDNAPEHKNPALKGVCHQEGLLIVADGHRIYEAAIDHGKSGIISPTGKQLKGPYPIKKFDDFVWGSSIQQLEIDVDELLKASDIFYTVGKAISGPGTVDIKDNVMSYRSVMDVNGIFNLSVSFVAPISLNAKYILDSMKLFKAAGIERVTVNHYGSMRAMIFKAENIKVLILPVRRVYA